MCQESISQLLQEISDGYWDRKPDLVQPNSMSDCLEWLENQAGINYQNELKSIDFKIRLARCIDGDQESYNKVSLAFGNQSSWDRAFLINVVETVVKQTKDNGHTQFFARIDAGEFDSQTLPLEPKPPRGIDRHNYFSSLVKGLNEEKLHKELATIESFGRDHMVWKEDVKRLQSLTSLRNREFQSTLQSLSGLLPEEFGIKFKAAKIQAKMLKNTPERYQDRTKRIVAELILGKPEGAEQTQTKDCGHTHTELEAFKLSIATGEFLKGLTPENKEAFVLKFTDKLSDICGGPAFVSLAIHLTTEDVLRESMNIVINKVADILRNVKP